ncbi:hypothetical protein [Aurantiacibacter rhizosphaerae]|uniref:DUF1269 domain-containing protein n=1 Tax=Aurantiacibacter rhizosphaerae TaxID=2691582 RepID=A0A844XGT0_9SPHN|nr:hypothetical protein [Aurantiacibacter rhizosphaerae]MWV28933.1 hypothetical protein [Aurantiacibacter rhizosphaerae]
MATATFFVIKSDQLIALNYLPDVCPVPVSAEWIDRGTDRNLSPSRVEQLLRTYHRKDPSPSVLRLRETAGIRAIFGIEHERNLFARAFADACARQEADRQRFLTAIYPAIADAQQAVDALVNAGVDQDAIAMLWNANRYMDPDLALPAGHSKGRVIGNVSAGGLAAAALGTAILIVPGIGPVAVAGAAVASALSSVATASGIIGATGAAMATMLSDDDVEDVAANHLEEQLRRGRIFVSVDKERCGVTSDTVGWLLETTGGWLV